MGNKGKKKIKLNVSKEKLRKLGDPEGNLRNLGDIAGGTGGIPHGTQGTCNAYIHCGNHGGGESSLIDTSSGGQGSVHSHGEQSGARTPPGAHEDISDLFSGSSR
jgi:hypothetical protein